MLFFLLFFFTGNSKTGSRLFLNHLKNSTFNECTNMKNIIVNVELFHTKKLYIVNF